jgi:uncharacterized protein YbaR (Trm112 family)
MMMKKPELLEMLACPLCESDVRYEAERQRIVCLACQHEYAVENGIPIMLDSRIIEQSIQTAEKHVPPPSNFLRRLHDSRFGKAVSPPPSYLNLNYRRINRLIDELGPDAKILEIGAGRERRLKNTIGVDIELSSNIDAVGDAHNLPFKGKSFDCILFISVLEHLRKPSQAVAEAYRVLRDGGYVHADTPFLLGFHAVPADYTRWTLQGIDELFSKFHRVESGVANGPSAAVVELLRSWIALFSKNDYLSILLSFIAGWLLFPLKYLDFILMKRKKAHTIAFGLFYTGKKVSG